MSSDTLLIVTTSFPQRGDGSEAAGAFVADFALAMAEHMPVRVVGPGTRQIREEWGGLPVWRFSAGSRPLSLLSPARPWHWLPIGLTLASMRRQTFAAASDGGASHALALWTLPSGWAARNLLRSQGVPYSIWALGSDIWSLGRIPPLRGLMRSVCREARNTYADGEGLAKDAEALTGRRFDFMASCRKLDGQRRLPIATKPPYRLLFLGRWHPNKGIDLLFDALDSLDSDDWTRISEVHIAGGGPLDSLVKQRVSQLQSQNRPLRLSGFLDRQQASAALAVADRLLLPSRIESIPVIFSDAIAFGIPVVSMPVGDLPELLAQGGGWVAESVDGASFASAMRASTAQNVEPQPMPPQLRARFSLDQVAEGFAQRTFPR